MFAHRYDRYILGLEVSQRSEKLEEFCNSHQTRLYWGGKRPRNKSAIDESVEKWILITDQGSISLAKQIGQNRHQQESIIRLLIDDKFSYRELTKQIKEAKKPVDWGNLRRFIEHSLKTTDICAIRAALCDSLDVSIRDKYTETRAALSLAQKDDTEFPKLLELVQGKIPDICS
ncbi:Uu.00g078320.m01.CDS01 [Anthostomella pinea]|uniref:Uu.00g078320.m01.CDS01 n=1 Tax=Anthostomella pinea TaxID=933095 RepID=A0AAI8YJ07_9PEZI|nr:Uu.00g078320.m01.CDS01 [Anthostomella pinea]